MNAWLPFQRRSDPPPLELGLPEPPEAAVGGSVQTARDPWRETASTQRAVLTAATAEVECTIAFIEQAIVALADRFVALTRQATAQARQVDDMLRSADLLVTPTETVSMTDLTDLMRTTLGQVVERIADMSNSAHAMTGALRDVSASVGRIDKFTADLNRINQQTRMLSLNATIEAARAGEAGRGFAVVADEVRQLSAQTAQLATSMQAEIGAIGASVRQGRAMVDQVAGIDISQNQATRARLEQLLTALLGRRAEIDAVIRASSQGSSDIAREISSIVGGFQFQDRSKQRLEHVVGMLGAGLSLLRQAEDGMPAPPDTEWLRNLAAGFTMQEVRDRFHAALGWQRDPATAAAPGHYAPQTVPPGAPQAASGELEMF